MQCPSGDWQAQAAEAVGSEPYWRHVLGLACHSTVKCLGQCALSGGKRHRDLQVVGGQDLLIGGSNCSEEGRVVGKVVGRVKPNARCGSACKGGDVCSRRVPARRTQPQTPSRGGKRALRPRFGGERAGAHVLEARTDGTVESSEHMAVEARRRDTRGVGKSAKRCSMAKQ